MLGPLKLSVFISKERQGVTERMSICRITWCLDFVSCVAFHRENRISGEVYVFVISLGKTMGKYLLIVDRCR